MKFSYPAPDDLFDTRRHHCGCLTGFDLALWKSVTIETCEEHD